MVSSKPSRDEDSSQNMKCTSIHEFSFTRELIAGGAAGAIASVVIAPMDLLRTMRQYDNESKLKDLSAISILKKIRKKSGWKCWYKGLKSSLLGYVASWAIYFTCYYYLKNLLIESKFGDFYKNIISAVISGFITSTLTSPIWVINAKAIVGDEDGIFAIIRSTFREEGICAFFRGLNASYLGLINVAIQFSIYEKLKSENIASRISSKEIQWFDTLYCSIISKCIATFVTYPHEVVRTRLVAMRQDNGRSYGLMQMIFTISEQEGLLGFYKGISVTLARVIPYTAIIFTFHGIFYRILQDIF